MYVEGWKIEQLFVLTKIHLMSTPAYFGEFDICPS